MANAEPGERETPAANEKINILLVDDRPDKLLSLQVMLEELRQNLVTASSGREALRCLLHQDFAVILLDVNMPVMDGFETAALIRQRPRSETTPIIFVSAVNDTETHVSRGYSLGAVDYILAPVVPEILRAKVAVFVDLFKKTEQIKRQGEERAEFVREQARRAEAEAAQKRAAFLAEASNVLAGSLDYQQTFDNLARLVVPQLADYCIIDVAEGDGVRQVAVAHRDPTAEPKLRQLAENYPSSMDSRHGANLVLRSGRSELCCEVTDDVLARVFDEERDRQIVRDLGTKCFLSVPLRARGRILGALTLVNTTADRVCGQSELSLAEELAQRAAIAVDNAALYRTAQEARIEAERANQAKDQFLATLSHELRTPLTPVLGSVLTLEMEPDLSPEFKSELQMIRRNIELEARLIDDLLDLSRIAMGKVQLHTQPVDAHALLRHALEICDGDIGAKDLALNLDLAASNTRLIADPARLQQVFWNLIKNAVKFTGQGGRLAIRTANPRERELAVEISDDGVGIEPGHLGKVFDAFEQGERAASGGLGLGLAITKAIVEMHHGAVRAHSDGRGQGSTFTVTLPTAHAEIDGAAPAGRPSSASSPREMRILLVEDHEDSNRSLTQLLRRRGYAVESAFTVQSALEIARSGQFDVLISDMGLPDGSGLQIMQQLTMEHRPIAGIALTGFGMEGDVRKSHEAGFQHHLIKPVDLNKLESVIQQVAPAAG